MSALEGSEKLISFSRESGILNNQKSLLSDYKKKKSHLKILCQYIPGFNRAKLFPIKPDMLLIQWFGELDSSELEMTEN